MPYQTVTLSSAGIPGASTPASLAWRNGGPATAVIYVSTTGTSTGVFTLQYTMDDVNLVGGSSLALWSGVSSGIGLAGTVFQTSSITTDGVFYSFLSPVAALRISSTANSSGGFIMKVIQGDSW